MTKFPGKGQVAALKTSPQTVLTDIQLLMKLAGFEQALPKNNRTGLKINISWQTWYPACSSTPWQLEGSIQTLQQAGYSDLVGIHNDTVVVNTADGEINNKHRFVTEKYNIPCLYLYNQEFEWFEYKPKRPFLVLDKVYPEGVYIPDMLIGKNMVQLPTTKTHVFTTITGAMKNAFGGLLGRQRHWTHGVIHETLVDLLAKLPPVKRLKTAMFERIGMPESAAVLTRYETKYDSRHTQRLLEGSGIKPPKLASYAPRIWDYWERNLDPDLFVDRTLEGQVKDRVVLITGGSAGIGGANSCVVLGAVS